MRCLTRITATAGVEDEATSEPRASLEHPLIRLSVGPAMRGRPAPLRTELRRGIGVGGRGSAVETILHGFVQAPSHMQLTKNLRSPHQRQRPSVRRP